MTDLPLPGTTESLSIEVTAELVDRFAALVGDDNSLHMNDAAARSFGFSGRVAHGMSYASFVSTLIGTRLPGPGALWASQTYRFLSAVYIGDCITITGAVTEVSKSRSSIRLSIEAVNQDGKIVMEGESDILLPKKRGGTKSSREPIPKPKGIRRVALVAGASGTLGRAISGALAKNGFALALCGRNADAIVRLAEDCEHAVAIDLDLTDGASVRDGVSRAIDTVGRPTVVVHCASAALPSMGPSEASWETYRHHFEIQVGGLHRLLVNVLPGMETEGGGQFILIGSTATNGRPPKGMAPYTSAKTAAASLVRSIAAELGPKGIRANIVSPHFMSTSLTARVPAKARKLVAAQTPLRRIAEIGEVASAVAFLAAESNGFITGHNLVMDGGATMP